MHPLSKFFKTFLFPIWAAFALNIITWLIVWLKIKPGPQTTPLHYNIFYGVDYAASGYYAYLLPAIGLSIWIINYFFYIYALNKDPFAARMLILVALAVQVFVLIAVSFLNAILA